MSIAPRRSVTNEAALRPHENAFRSSAWSIPDGIDIPPQPMTPRSALAFQQAPPTERRDTMEAHMPSSFRVYTPDETRDAPMRRRSFHSIEVEPASESVGARTLLKWTGIGIVAGLCVLTALILLLGDDGKRVAGNSARATIGAIPAEQPAAAPVTPTTTPAAIAPQEPPIEVEPTPAPKKATVTKKQPVVTKKKS